MRYKFAHTIARVDVVWYVFAWLNLCFTQYRACNRPDFIIRTVVKIFDFYCSCIRIVLFFFLISFCFDACRIRLKYYSLHLFRLNVAENKNILTRGQWQLIRSVNRYCCDWNKFNYFYVRKTRIVVQRVWSTFIIYWTNYPF